MASAAQVRELLNSFKEDVIEVKQAVAELKEAGKPAVPPPDEASAKEETQAVPEEKLSANL